MLELLAQWTKLGQYWQEESIMLPWVSLTGDEKPITAAFVEAASIKAAALEIKADPINAAWRSQRRSHKGSSPWNKAGPIEAAFLNTMCSPQCFLHCLPQCLSTFAAALECPLLELPLMPRESWLAQCSPVVIWSHQNDQDQRGSIREPMHLRDDYFQAGQRYMNVPPSQQDVTGVKGM
eukprot:1144421-Pelagomonas_calceolata.AAC.5